MKLKELGEFGLIERIAGRVSRRSGVRIGIGDDAAAFEPTAGFLSLVTTDMLVEGVHFDLSLCDPVSLGRKALAVNLSDVAAMGGAPCHFLLSLAVPPHISVEFLDDFVGGMLAMGEDFGVSLIGGDTSSSLSPLVISVTVIGEQSPALVVPRSGARPGDMIFVTGTIGDSSLGLALLKAGERQGTAVARHLDPLPRVREGMTLAQEGIPSAMIDISDGLLADLGHILDLSRAGARLRLQDLPLSLEYLEKYPAHSQDAYTFPLCGGEDYELLFTVPPARVPLVRRLIEETGTMITAIGEVTPGAGISLISPDGGEYRAQCRGFDHFSHKQTS
ncbi:MAG TPA: thiamine-phosphate kinase [Geobacteraceae bacterium]